eukprot:EG_transcript_14660
MALALLLGCLGLLVALGHRSVAVALEAGPPEAPPRRTAFGPEDCGGSRAAISPSHLSILSIPRPQFKIAVFNDGDIVSNALRGGRMWEGDTLQFLIRELARGPGPGRLLDIGANVGWFSLYAAALGHDVVAVEAMRLNFDLLKYSLCLNVPNVQLRMHVYHAAVGEREAVCAMKSPAGNRGNGNMDCVQDRSGRLQLKGWEHWDDAGRTEHEEDRVPMATLDSLLAGQRIDVVKIDVEGYEFHALAGGRRLLRNVSAVHTEFSPFMLRKQGSDPLKYLEFLRDAGFYLFHRTQPFHDLPAFLAALDQQPGLIVDLRAVRRPKLAGSGHGPRGRTKPVAFGT